MVLGRTRRATASQSGVQPIRSSLCVVSPTPEQGQSIAGTNTPNALDNSASIEAACPSEDSLGTK